MFRLFASAFLYFPILVLLTSGTAHSETVDDAGSWLALFAQGDIHDDAACRHHRLKWWFDGHARFLDDTDGFHQSIVRPGIGLALTENAAAWAGYGWIRTTPISGADFDEHRIWQQITWSRSFDPFTFALRSRLEQRFLETGDDAGVRFRQLFRIQHDLPQFPRLSLVSWDELFINQNTTDWGAVRGFDQNRVFVGFGWKHTPESRWRTEIGYLNQMVDNSRSDDRSNHILSINFYR